jgi:hypothetical protein
VLNYGFAPLSEEARAKLDSRIANLEGNDRFVFFGGYAVNKEAAEGMLEVHAAVNGNGKNPGFFFLVMDDLTALSKITGCFRAYTEYSYSYHIKPSGLFRIFSGRRPGGSEVEETAKKVLSVADANKEFHSVFGVTGEGHLFFPLNIFYMEK